MTDKNASFGNNLNEDIAKVQASKSANTSKKKWIPKSEYVAKLKAEGKYNPKGYKSQSATSVPTPAVKSFEDGVDITSYIPDPQNIVNHNDTLKALEFAWKENMPVLLTGETGTGKTTLVKELYNRLQQPLLRLNLNGNTTTDEFVGKMTLSSEGTKYIDGIFTRAMKYGYGLLLDEINAGRPEVLFILQAVLERNDKGELTPLTLAENHGEIVKPHPNFRVFATMNPSDGYIGVNDLNRATRDRFPVSIEVPYPDLDTEVKIVKSKLPKKPKVADAEIKDAVLLAQDIRNGAKQGEYEAGISTRNLIQWFQVNEHYGNLIESAKYTVLGKCNEDDRNAIESILKVYFSASTEVNETDGKTGEKYRKGHLLQACDQLLEVHHHNKYETFGVAKQGSVFEVVQVKGGKVHARLLRGEVVIPDNHPKFDKEQAGETVTVSHAVTVRLDNVEVCRTRRVDTNR